MMGVRLIRWAVGSLLAALAGAGGCQVSSHATVQVELEARIRGVRELGKAWDKAEANSKERYLRAIIAAANDPDRPVRDAVCDELVRIGKPGASLVALSMNVPDEGYFRYPVLSRSLVRTGPDALGELLYSVGAPEYYEPTWDIVAAWDHNSAKRALERVLTHEAELADYGYPGTNYFRAIRIYVTMFAGDTNPRLVQRVMRECAGQMVSADQEQDREAALRLLRFMGHSNMDLENEATRAIRTGALNDSNTQVRAAAARALIDLGDREATAHLARMATQDPSDAVRAAALANPDPGNLGTLERCLKEDQPAGCRGIAAETLAKMATPEAIELLRGVLNDADAGVRRHARIALAVHGDSNMQDWCLGELERLLLADRFNVYEFAPVAVALKGLAPAAPRRAKAIECLVRGAERVKREGHDRAQLDGAAVALRATEMAPLLEQWAVDDEPFPCENWAAAPELQESAVRALGVLGGPGSVPAIVSALDGPHPVYSLELRRAAIKSLAQIGSEAAFARLIAALDDEDVVVAISAARCLGEKHVAAAVPRLRLAAKSEIPGLARAGAEALERIAEPSSRQTSASGQAAP